MSKISQVEALHLEGDKFFVNKTKTLKYADLMHNLHRTLFTFGDAVHQILNCLTKLLPVGIYFGISKLWEIIKSKYGKKPMFYS